MKPAVSIAFLLAVLVVAAIALDACGGSSSEPADGSATPGQSATSTATTQAGDADFIRLEKVSIFDPAANGEAFTFLKPSGWLADGGVVWRHDLSNLASTSLQAWDPNSAEAVQVFPLIPFTWQDGGVPFFPVGSIYLGNQVQPPIFEPVDFVQQMVLPTFRSQFATQVLEWEELPGVAQQVAASVQEDGLNKTVRAGRVSVEYFVGDTRIHEDFYVTLVFSQAPGIPITLWGPERIYSFRAEAGELDDASALMHSVVFSAQVNQRWLNEYLQVVQLWNQGQLQSIQSAGELSRYIAQVNDDILDITTQTFERQQQVNDRISEQMSETIRGVETYETPFDDFPVELPGGYENAWTTANGDYILSNDAFFDPNIGSSVDWERIRAR